MKKIILLIVLLLVCKLSYGVTNWVLVDCYPGECVYINANIKVSWNGPYIVWVRTQYDNSVKSTALKRELASQYKNIKYLKVNYCLIEFLFDKDGNNKALELLYYDVKGNLIRQFEWDEYKIEWDTKIPDSRGEVLFDAVKEIIDNPSVISPDSLDSVAPEAVPADTWNKK
jgi:hypothetical protein